MTDLIRRRDAMAGAALVGALSALPAVAQSAVEARGRVIEEGTNNGLPGVMVSNGRTIVKSDPDGNWALPVRDGDSVFVIKPTGYMTPVDADGLPRFAVVHQPDGSPDGMRYHGVAPTGSLPASIDFPLRRQDEPARFDVLVFTDPQPESEMELGFVRDDVVAAASGIRAAFGITTGDVMFDDLTLYPRSNRIVGALGLPWYNLPGNHDMNYEAADDGASKETFKRVFGARHYAWQYGGTIFVAFDNVEYLGNEKYRGRIGPAQLGFLRAVLAEVPREQLVVLCMHIPLRTLAGDAPNFAAIDWQDLVDALHGRPNTLSLSGHTHTNEHHYLGDAKHHHHVLSAVSGSWWSGPFDVRGIPVALAADGAPNGCHVLSIDGNQATMQLIPAHYPARGQMRIMVETQNHASAPEVLRTYRVGALLGGPIPREATDAANLLVNLFDGGPRSTVSFSVAGGGHAMERVARLDPFVQEVYARNADTKKPWVKPEPSSHIWQARLPALPAGTHRIAVTAHDEYGRAHEASLLLEVTD